MTAKYYLQLMSNACNGWFVRIGRNDREEHLRLAREVGGSLSEFNTKEQKEILSSSYGMIYIKACLLKPVLDAKEWVAEMLVGQKQYDKVCERQTAMRDALNLFAKPAGRELW